MAGNRRGVVAVLGCALSIFWPGALIFGFPGVMGPYWQETFGVGKGAVGNTLFFVLAALGVFMFFVGRWQEKFGTRLMITIGALICGLSIFLVAYAPNIYYVYLWAFLTGTSSSFIYTPALTAVQRWFVEKRGLVSGIVNLVFGISAAIMSPIFGSMLKTMGYLKMNMYIAVACLLVGLSAAQFTETPEKVRITQRQSRSTADQESLAALNRFMTVKESIQTKSFWYLWLIWALQGAAGIAMVSLSVAFGLARGLTLGSAVAILTTFNMMNGLGRLLTGHLSDLFGRNLTMGLTFFVAGCAYLLLPYQHSLIALAVLAGLVGLAFGALFAVSAPLVSDCFGLRHFGAILGLIFTAYGFVAGLLGPSLSGYLLDLTKGNYHIVFIYLGIFCLLSSFLVRGVVVPPQMVSAGSTGEELPPGGGDSAGHHSFH